MSAVTNVLLSLSNQEFWGDDEHRDESAALDSVNAWFKEDGLVDLAAAFANEAHYGIHAYLYGGGFNHLDIEGFIKVVASQEWLDPDNLQLFLRGEQEDRFELVQLWNAK